MSWKDLLQKRDEYMVFPWVGGRELRSGPREWIITGRLPEEHGWYDFKLNGRSAKLLRSAEPVIDWADTEHGYLVGDRLVMDTSHWFAHCEEVLMGQSSPVHLLESGLDLFVRIKAGQTHEGGPLIFDSLLMPLGPEDDVLKAYLDNTSIDEVIGVSPALHLAFKFQCWQRDTAEKRRIELERLRREEEVRRAVMERRQALVEQLGDGAGRREMAKVDFAEAARAALAIGNATYLDHRAAYRKGEIVVRFRFEGQRFECVCDEEMSIIDAGICLTDHDTGEKGDTFFTLESLPGVIAEAKADHKLVIFRHVD